MLGRGARHLELAVHGTLARAARRWQSSTAGEREEDREGEWEREGEERPPSKSDSDLGVFVPRRPAPA